MPALIGKKFKVYSANSFARSFASDAMYLYVGKALPWGGESTTPKDTPSYHHAIWNNIVGAVKIGSHDVSLGIKRNNWTYNTVYDRYHHDNESMGTNYYVLAGEGDEADRNVYKCLDNNGGEPSTVKPSHKNLATTREGDGYAWKYMYTIPDTTWNKFTTNSVIPVFTQRNVHQFSKRGAIIHLPIPANTSHGMGQYYRGLGFVNTSYSVSAVNPQIATTIDSSSATNEIKITADSGLATIDNYYNNCAFYITTGIAAGTYRRIVQSKKDPSGSDSSSNLVFGSPISNINNGDNFKIGPQVVVTEQRNEGRGFLGIGNTNKAGNVTSIDVSLIGRGYANGYANVFVNGIYDLVDGYSPNGSGANVELVIPPDTGGHGYSAEMELDAKYVIVAPTTPIAADSQAGIFVGSGDIRQAGVIKNPLDAHTGRVAKAESYDQRTTLYFDDILGGGFGPGVTVYNTDEVGTETASGVIFNRYNENGVNHMSLVNVLGRFADNDVVYDRKGDTATISSVDLHMTEYPINSGEAPKDSVISGGLAKYTGIILYNNNLEDPITLDVSSPTKFQFVFEF